MFFSSTRLTFDTPGIGGDIQCRTHLGVDGLTGSQGLVQFRSPMILRRVVAVRFSIAIMGFSTP